MYFLANTSEGHRGFLEVGGSLCSSGADRDKNPQSLLHPGGRLPVHRPALQQWPNGQRGKTHAGTHLHHDFLLPLFVILHIFTEIWIWGGAQKQRMGQKQK